MVDEEDLALVKAAAQREGRPESQYFREAFHLIALRARRPNIEWEIPQLDFGHAVSAEEIHEVTADSATDTP